MSSCARNNGAGAYGSAPDGCGWHVSVARTTGREEATPRKGTFRSPPIPSDLVRRTILVALVLLLTLAGWPARATAGADGAALYAASCAACHGTSGTGADPGHVDTPLALPDFSDCSFASREPDADWGAVIQEGGPARGFSRWMPAFGDALSDDEVALVLGHVRTFCDNPRWPRGDLNLPKALRTEKAFPEDEFLWIATVGTGEATSVKNKLIYEKRFGARN